MYTWFTHLPRPQRVTHLESGMTNVPRPARPRARPRVNDGLGWSPVPWKERSSPWVGAPSPPKTLQNKSSEKLGNYFFDELVIFDGIL